MKVRCVTYIPRTITVERGASRSILKKKKKKKEILKRQENLEIIRSIASSFNLFQYYYVVEIEWIAFSIAMPL